MGAQAATETVSVRLACAIQAASDSLNAQLQGEHRLPLSEHRALLRLSRAESGRMRRVDLARALLLTPSGVTRLLSRLEQARFVAKGSSDRDARVSSVLITDTGRARLAEATSSRVARVKVLLAQRYSREELLTLAELLGRLDASADSGEEAMAVTDRRG
jgi:DNA-binding MarR family transcriptional regulator